MNQRDTNAFLDSAEDAARNDFERFLLRNGRSPEESTKKLLVTTFTAGWLAGMKWIAEQAQKDIAESN